MSQQPSLAQSSTLGMLTPADIWRIIRKRLFLIIACFIVLGLGGTGAIVAWWEWWPSYTAEAQVVVEPGQGQIPGMPQFTVQEMPSNLYVPYVKAQEQAIKNERVLQGALKKLEGEQNTYLGPNATHELYLDLQASYIPDSQNIVVSLRGRNREQTQAIVREVLNQYIEQLDTDRREGDRKRQQDLRAEHDDLQKQLQELGRKLAAQREEGNVIITDDRSSVQLAGLTELIKQLANTQGQLAEASAAWTQFQEVQKKAEQDKDPTGVLQAFPEVMEELRKDLSIKGVSEQLGHIAQSTQSLKQRLGPKHEAVVQAEALLRTAQIELQAKQAEVLGLLYQQEAAVLKSKYEQARRAQAELLDRVAEARQAAVSAAKLSAEYRAREAQYNQTQKQLNTVTEGLENMRIHTALTRPNIHITRPVIPIEPSEPRRLLYICAVLIFSILVGLGLSFMIELMDTRLRTPLEVVRQVGVPLLGSIPDLSEDERLALDTNLAMVTQTVPQSLMAEAFRQMRTNLLFASDKPIRTILVTSPNPRDGKSTVAANLAITMARGGTRVLLIEANFRRPYLARAFDIPDGVGLSNVLVGLSEVSDAIQATRIENLDMLVCGALPPSPAELLGSTTMRHLIRQVSEKYDTVIIDGAPMLVVADNYLLAEAVDGVVMVYRAGENTRGLAHRAARQVLSLRARLLGAVLNCVRATKGGYFREAYQAYYDYSGSARLTDLAPARKVARPAGADSKQPQP